MDKQIYFSSESPKEKHFKVPNNPQKDNKKHTRDIKENTAFINKPIKFF